MRLSDKDFQFVEDDINIVKYYMGEILPGICYYPQLCDTAHPS